MNSASILEIDPAWRYEIEDMGSKPKFWFRYENTMWLFKRARPNTGEHWAEKVASEIASLIKLPTHEVRIARFEKNIGCAVRTFLDQNQNEILVHGNELLAGAVANYDKDKQRGQADHNFQNIVHTIEKLIQDEKVREGISIRLVGYFVFDALVGNTDRHHENWGMILKFVMPREEKTAVKIQPRIKVTLAPTFDHGSSLGRELLEDRARLLLEDPQAIIRYICKAKGGIFDNKQAPKGLSPIALVERIAMTYPNLVAPWKNRIAALPRDFAKPFFENIPPSCMSATSRKFVLAFLAESRRLIASIP